MAACIGISFIDPTQRVELCRNIFAPHYSLTIWFGCEEFEKFRNRFPQPVVIHFLLRQMAAQKQTQ